MATLLARLDALELTDLRSGETFLTCVRLKRYAER
jgi:hypothetical protein